VIDASEASKGRMLRPAVEVLPDEALGEAPKDAGSVTVRAAKLADAEAIRTIYNAEVTESTVTFDLVPRTLADQQAWLREHDGAHPAIVAEEDGQVIGFGSLTAYRPRPAYSTSVEDSVYVHDDHRGKGVGKLLLESLLQRASDHGFHAVFARIVGIHEASIALHKACGFEVVGTEREVGRKFGQWLDVVVMQKLV
jgi:phosphinothricin acetyltransferase